MTDLDIILKALRDEAEWQAWDGDRAEMVVADALQRVAERVEEGMALRVLRS
jgi:trehalose utilization protein